MAVDDVKAAAHGQWPQILRDLGVPESFLTGKHGPCPKCEGKDRFRFTDFEGTGAWICNVCGAGDGFELLAMVLGCTRQTAIADVGKHLDVHGGQAPKRDDARGPLRRMLSECVKDRTPVKEYLHGRGLSVMPKVLRYHPALPYVVDGKVEGKYPAMLAVVTGANGSAQSVHRTYLADVPTRKKMMPPVTSGGLRGAAIRLFELEGDELAVTEGIETAIAVHEIAAEQDWNLPVWSCVCADMMAQFEPPPQVKKLMISADHDANFAGHSAAYRLAHRMAAKGLSVRVKIPSDVGKDWLDVHNERKRDA